MPLDNSDVFVDKKKLEKKPIENAKVTYGDSPIPQQDIAWEEGNHLLKEEHLILDKDKLNEYRQAKTITEKVDVLSYFSKVEINAFLVKILPVLLMLVVLRLLYKFIF